LTTGVSDIVDQAIDWHLRLADATAEEWHSFVLWLESDQAHRDAYDRITMDDAMLSPSLEIDQPLIAANDTSPLRNVYRWSLAGGGAIAAALVAMVMVQQQQQQTASNFYTIDTAPGHSRIVKLDDGTSVEMNGGTRLTLKHGDNRYAALDSGEATFRVRHDAQHPFELHSGKFAIQDLGTVFNVTREGPRLGVQVAEGAVMLKQAEQGVTLRPGMALAIHDAEGRAAISRIAPESVGGWRHGMVSFRNTPVEAVALAVERSTGAKLRIAPALSKQSFTGTIHLTGSNDVVIPRVAALLNADWRRVGEDWMLTSRGNEDQ